jgi:DsbC/DsbD-like thiol-disulfide interchange protein
MDAQRKPPALVFVLILFATGPSALAQGLVPPGGGAEARLIDGGGGPSARYAGLRLRLPGEALTSWRDPGEAGVAPVFDFSLSGNLAAAEALFPQPERFDEAGAQAFGYKHEVTFPLRLIPKDPAKPIALAVAVDFSVCDKLCYPLHESLRLDLPPQGEAAPDLAAALDQVPRRLDAQETRAFAALVRAPEQKGAWRLTLRAPARDLLVEAPPGFFVASRRDGENFVLTVAAHPEDREVPAAPLRLTATGKQPVEFFMSLP